MRHEKRAHPDVFERRHAWTNLGPGKKPSCGSVVIHLGTIVHDLLPDVIKAMICMQPPLTSVLEVPKLTIALDPDLWKKVEDKAKDARRNIREVEHHLTVPHVLQRHLDITICIEISLRH